jgi:hypothetical protein
MLQTLRGKRTPREGQDSYLPPPRSGVAPQPTTCRCRQESLADEAAGLGGVESVEDEPLFAKFDYYLDESDPDIVILRRQDGAFVAAFSAIGATREGIGEAAKEDYGRLMKEERISLEHPYSP